MKQEKAGKVVGVLSLAIVALLVALSVVVVWACAFVHWLLAAGVGCLVGTGWLLLAMVTVVALSKREAAG